MEEKESVATESQPSQETSETTPIASETTEPSTQEASEASKLDFWNPETYGETPIKDVVSQIQSEFNKKSTTLKQQERDYKALQAEHEETVNSIRQALADPEVYKRYRQQLRYEDPPTRALKDKAPQPDFTKMHTPEDVQKHFKDVMAWTETKIADVEAKAARNAQQAIIAQTAPETTRRWQTALDSMESKYGEAWNTVSQRVSSAITSRKYAYNGKDETQLLEKVFRAECPEEYSEHLQKSFIKRTAEKNSASTVSPKSTAKRSIPKGNDVNSIIARVQAKLGNK